VREVGPHFQARLAELARIPLVFDARGMGLVGCVECTVRGLEHSGMSHEELLAFDTDLGARIDRHCQSMGLMLRPMVNLCVFSPPLIITREEIDTMFDILREGILRTMHEIEAEFGYQLR
jgi:adenosylmethionine-8-amino-7-oxononanoate aminotransferase